MTTPTTTPTPEPGYDCEFVEELPKFVRSSCPICLLVLREPYQVTCCGKSFCKDCIHHVMESSFYCPACKQDDFCLYPDVGLRQELYSFRVFCSNREKGCEWQGELREMDQHLNLEPKGQEEAFRGCAFTRVECLYCSQFLLRMDIERHQSLVCEDRPFTCLLCEDYESTYEDVTANHTPMCKCRPVECPNVCGVTDLQHQHLEEHVSAHCPLSEVECEFSDAGCDARVCRKDLPSHLAENIVAHMSLLAQENRQLREQLRRQSEELTSLVRAKMAKDKKRLKTLMMREQANLAQSLKSAVLENQAKPQKQRKKLRRPHKARKTSLSSEYDSSY